MSRNSGKQLRGWYAYSDSKTWEANVSATRQTLRKRSERVVLDLLKHADVSDDCGFSSHFNVFAGEECGQHIWIRYTSCSKTLSSPSLGGKRIGRWEQRGQHWYAARTYQPPVVHTSLASDFDPEFRQPMRTTKTYESAVVPTINVPEDTVILRPIQSTKTFEVPVETLTSIVYVPRPCNTGSCHPSFTTKTVLVPTGAPAPTSSSGCSPACPSLCPPAHLPRPIPSHPHRPVPVPTGNNHPEYHNTTYPEPRPIEGRFWRIKDLSRHCAKDGKSCDYEFAIEADGKTEHCNINRKPGSDAALESWTNVPCNKKSHKTVSWGYVTEPAPAFAVVTVVEGKVLAWFGVADINGQKVTSSNPFGSGHYGNLGPDQVYTY